MPVDTDDNPGQEHRGGPEEHHDRIAETHVEFFLLFSTPFWVKGGCRAGGLHCGGLARLENEGRPLGRCWRQSER
jgi:hypothetical protein